MGKSTAVFIFRSPHGVQSYTIRKCIVFLLLTDVLNLSAMQVTKFSRCTLTKCKVDWEKNVSGYSRVINIVSSPAASSVDAEKCCDKELSVTSVPDTCDYKRSSGTGFGQPYWDHVTLPSEHAQFEKCFPIPSLEMTVLSPCVWLQNEATNGSVSIPAIEGLASSAVMWT